MDVGRVEGGRVDGVSIDVVARDGVVVLRLGGEIDMANADEVSTRLLSESVEGSSIVLDLGGLTYVDSAGIRMLFDLSEQLGRNGLRLVLAVGHDAPVRRALEITKLDTLVSVESSLARALEAATS